MLLGRLETVRCAVPFLIEKLQPGGNADIRMFMQFCHYSSVALLVAALVVILSPRFDASNKHWAFGLTGTILGFWFRK
jgi:hypothetical protein